MAPRGYELRHWLKKNKELFIAILFVGLFALVYMIFKGSPPPEVVDANKDRYDSMTALLKAEPANAYKIIKKDRDNPVLVIVPHGGRIEPRTGNIGQAIAGKTFSYYEFSGELAEGNYDRLHVKATNYDEPELRELLGKVGYSLSVHGTIGDTEVTYVGGLDEAGVQAVIAALRQAGFNAVEAPGQYAGKEVENFVNGNLRQKGIQLEISQAQRYALFDTKSDRKPNDKFKAYTEAVKKALEPLAANPEGY